MKNFYKQGMLIIMFLLAMAVLVLLAMGQAKAANMPIYIPHSFQQEITGKVTGQNGEPLLGVTVFIKNNRIGTTTNIDGDYSITASKGDTLIFSFIGYISQQVTVSNQPTIDISLKEDVAALGEVEINAGYYSVTERERTGNISRVTAEEIENQPVLNPLAAIQGRMPGVEIIESTGVPGGGFDIKIRGTNSLRTGGNNPLFIVDGVPFPSGAITNQFVAGANIRSNPLSAINPSDIASIEVLKDADATAIYGSRGANGVVLITTKQGKSGKTQVNLNMSTGVGEVSNFMDLLNTEQYLDLRRDAYELAETEPTAAGAPDLVVWDRDRYVNWQKELIGNTARLRNFQASLSGGNENTSFRAGTGFREETTVFSGDFKNRRFSGNVNLRHTSENQKFTGNISGTFSSDNNNLPKTDLTLSALTLPPNAPILYNEDGSLNWENSTWTNPLASLQEKYTSEINTLILHTDLGYKIFDGLELSSGLGYTKMYANQLQTTPQSAFDPAQTFNQRRASQNNSELETWIIEPKLRYRNKFGNFDFDVLVGGTIQEDTRINSGFRASGFGSDALLENLGAANSIQVINSNRIDYKYQAIFSRLHLDYKDKYLVNLTGRRDGSSRFGPGREYGNFGAVGTAWIFSEENFIKKSLGFINFGKLRFSYGTTGSDQIGDYEFLDLWRASRYSYQGITGFNPVRIANPDFGWETNRKLEMGLELGFFDNAINLSSSYYRNRSSNQLVGFPLPGTTGFTRVQSNFPATVENKGLEFLLTTRNFDNDNFRWETSFNISFQNNKLLEYEDLESSPYANLYSIGKPLNLLRSYRYTGVNPETGVFDFADLNGDGFISYPEDIEDNTDFDPDYYGGLRNSLTYKSWNLDFFFQFSKQNGLGYYNAFTLAGSRSNQPVAVLDRWQATGDQTSYQKPSVQFNDAFFSYLNATGTSFNVSDASYIRLKNVSLSYTLPVLGNLSSRIYFQGQNLFTITDYKGLDPENPGLNSLPPLRVYSIGLELNL